MKNANGNGTVYRLKGNRRKPYTVCFSIWNEDHTKRKRVYYGSYKTRREAETARISIITASNSVEKQILNKSITFKECAEEAISRAEKSLRPSSILTYKGCLKLLQPLWDITMTNLTGELYQQFVDELITKGIKAKRLTNVNTLTHKAVKVAIRKGILTHNVIQGTDIGGANKKNDRQRRPFTHEELSILWKHTDDEIVQSILILIYTGMRISEYRDIRHKDYYDNCLHIEEAKTQAGIRIVPVHHAIKPFVENLLAKYERLDGYSIYDTYRVNFKKTCSQFGMDHIPHETRHTFATLLDEQKIDITITKVLIGHTVSDITKGTYTHEHFSRLVEAIEKLPTY